MRTRRTQERESADRRHGVAATETRKGQDASATTLRTRTGNAGMQALIGRMSDAQEQNADRIANAVMRSPSAIPNVQRMCADCADDGVLLVQRQPDPDAAPVDAPPDPVDGLIDLVSAAIEGPLSEITLEPPKDPKRALTPELVLKQQWPPIRTWIIGIGTKRAPRVPAAFAALDVPEITDPLRALPRADRIRVADGVVDRLIQGVGSETPETYRDEFNRLARNARQAMEPSADPLVGYVAMRDGLKATFGSIDAMNAYFTTLVPAEFPPGTAKVFGRQSLVHPELKKALAKATDFLQSDKVPAGTFDRVVAGLADVTTLAGKVHHRGSWAISIRENRNNPSEIGNHSFGFAIDIDSTANPNLPKFRWDVVKQLTGFNVYGPDIAGAKAGQPYATALRSAQHFREASDTFRARFDSQSHFEATLAAEAGKHQIPLPPAELFKAVAAASQRGKPGTEGLAALKRTLLDALNREEARIAVPDTSGGEGSYSASEDPLVLATLVSALRPKIKDRRDLTRLMPFVLAQVINPLDTPAFARTAELAILFDRRVIAELKRIPENIRRYEMPNSLRLRLAPSAKDAEVATLASSLVELHGIFAGMKTGKGDPIGFGTSLPAIAAHGFMNLEPELVAALTSSEGGNLVWLGATYGTKDWMHFQLKSPPKITPQGTWP
jgi:hypothetical protein